MSRGAGWLQPLRELASAVGMLTGWDLFGGNDDDPPPQPRGPGVLAVQSMIMIAVAAVWCLAKIAFYGGEMAAGWLVVFVPLALPLALAIAVRPPRVALGLITGGLIAVPAGLLTVLFFHHHVAGFWLAFLGLSVTSLVAGTVFGYVTTARRRASGTAPGPASGPASG